jgi:hypothetical protein
LKTLDSLVERASRRIDAALDVEDVARSGRLLAAQEESKAAFGRAARRQIYKMVGAGALAIVGGLAVIAGISAASSIFATLAGTTGYAIPLAIAGAAVFAAGAIFLGMAAVNYKRLKNSWKSLNDSIGRALPAPAGHPSREASKSSL